VTRFTNGQRVTVIDGDDVGKTGRVTRIRQCDNGAWVRLDSEPAHPCFSKGDDRHNDVLLYPEQTKAGA
jgi:hypothetical protein